MEYRRGAHTVFEIHLHLVWITKYRRPALTGEIATRVRDLIRDICGQHEVSIMKGHVSKDHVHLLISLPPQVTISRLMQWLKGRTAHHLLAEFPHLKKQFWGRHLWARGYFCCSSGNVTDDVIAKYIAEQNVDQGGVDIVTLGFPIDAATEAFDEPLTTQQVLAIASAFIAA